MVSFNVLSVVCADVNMGAKRKATAPNCDQDCSEEQMNGSLLFLGSTLS